MGFMYWYCQVDLLFSDANYEENPNEQIFERKNHFSSRIFHREPVCTFLPCVFSGVHKGEGKREEEAKELYRGVTKNSRAASRKGSCSDK